MFGDVVRKKRRYDMFGGVVYILCVIDWMQIFVSFDHCFPVLLMLLIKISY